MFPEISGQPNNKKGSIEVITGCMFSGKTEELIRRLKRATIARQKVEIFKAAIDTRYAENEIVSHDATTLKGTPVDHSSNILLLASDVDVIGIDEAQFFDNGLADVCNILSGRGIRVIVAGLDIDFRGKPFGPMPYLLAIAEFVTKVHAICERCGSLAHYSYRKNTENKLVMLGAQENYEPLCRKCYNEAMHGELRT
jgi:thymidine kinase